MKHTTSTIADLARQLLDLDEGELEEQEKRVIERAVKRLAVSRNVDEELQEKATFGQRVADKVAAVGGSWGFIIAFAMVIFGWVVLNSFILASHAYDPYPYILLNLGLSMLAAVQAPVILMSQNRQATRDRLVAGHDYEVNLKAEIEIAALHEKLDEIRANELALLCKGIADEIREKPRPAGV